MNLSEKERTVLCQEIRDFLVSHVSKTGGHLASNLGVVELTVAIETVFDTRADRLVFDVGHQSYVHKLLTNRQADFDTLRQFGGMAGFPKPICCRTCFQLCFHWIGNGSRKNSAEQGLSCDYFAGRWCCNRRNGIRGTQ